MKQPSVTGAFVSIPFVLLLTAAAAADGAPPECPDYAAKLESCAPYTCSFTHPITGATLERRIIGLTGGICTTVEAMPGKRSMRCEFPADVRKAVAAFVRRSQAAEAGGKTIGGTLTVDSGGAATSTSSIDGKPVANPLQQAMANGICKVGQ